MDSKNESFEVEFTNECIEEMIEIYDYISNKLEVTENVLNLANTPVIYGRRNYLN